MIQITTLNITRNYNNGKRIHPRIDYVVYESRTGNIIKSFSTFKDAKEYKRKIR